LRWPVAGAATRRPPAALARASLEKSLSTWRDGGRPGTIAGSEPAIEAVDSTWQAGRKLGKFEILREEGGEGDRRFDVRLTLDGKDEDVHYVVIGKGARLGLPRGGLPEDDQHGEQPPPPEKPRNGSGESTRDGLCRADPTLRLRPRLVCFSAFLLLDSSVSICVICGYKFFYFFPSSLRRHRVDFPGIEDRMLGSGSGAIDARRRVGFMIVGVPRESFPGERRVALVPAVIPGLLKAGLEVVVEAGAGGRGLLPGRRLLRKRGEDPAGTRRGLPRRRHRRPGALSRFERQDRQGRPSAVALRPGAHRIPAAAGIGRDEPGDREPGGSRLFPSS